MNSANLEIMERIVEQLRPNPIQWSWYGRIRHQVRKGLTETEALQLKLQYGGNVERIEP